MTNYIVTEKVGNVFWIRFNRPDKYNAITIEMYHSLASALDRSGDDDEVLITVLTGTGPFYSAGSDFSPEELQSMGDSHGTDMAYKVWTDKLIVHAKLLVALVNGPAIGIACTTLALFDVVVASDQAYFFCPFTQLGLNPEGASSCTFLQLMGYTKAVRLLLLSEKVSAKEACDIGLVSQVLPHAEYVETSRKMVEKYSRLAHQSVLVSKRLMRPESLVDKLLTVNRKECEALRRQFNSEETLKRIMSKFSSKM